MNVDQILRVVVGGVVESEFAVCVLKGDDGV